MNTQYLPQIALDWKQIDTVFLDMDGTLLDLHFDNYFWLKHLPERLAALRGISVESASSYLNQHHQRTQHTLDWYCLDYWQTVIQTDITLLKHEIAHKIQWRNGAEAFLKFLRGLDKQVVLLTNAHDRSVALKFKHVPLKPYLDDVLISHHFKLPKEHPAFWQTLEQYYPLQKQRSLFIDDNIQVLKAAQHYGIAHLLWVQQPDSTKAPHPPQSEFVNLLDYAQLMRSSLLN